ncbi:MAG: hypothetical protein WBF83_03775 [Moheibacter sp.]
MELAIIKEINKEYIEAVKHYEEKIANKDTAILSDSYINLAFLYWSFAFEYFEFVIPNNISEEWSIIGKNRYPRILELGLKQYPNSAELHFWKKYFQHIIFGEDFTEQDCKELLEKYRDDNNVVPYFFLYLFNNEKYKEKRDFLLKECIKYPTAKNLYIKSIIE